MSLNTKILGLRARRAIYLAVFLLPGGLSGGAHAQNKHGATLGDLETLQEADYLRLSPDGSTLAYTTGTYETEGNIWLIRTSSGSVPHKVGQGRLPLWSPDSKRLAYYSATSGTDQLWVLDFQSGYSEQVTNFKEGINPDPWTVIRGSYHVPSKDSWSPDGSKLVFASQVARQSGKRDNTKDSDVTGRGSGGEQPLVLTDKTAPDWTLSGVFCHGFGDRKSDSCRSDVTHSGKDHRPSTMVNQIFVADIGRKTLRQLTKDESVYFHPDWSPDGQKIVCASSDGQSLDGFGVAPTNIYVFDVNNGRKTALTRGSGDKWFPQWSPDGRWIAYLGGEHFGKINLFVIPATGGTPVTLTSKLDRTVEEPVWLPDSQSLLLVSRDGVSRPILRIGVPAGDLKRISDGEPADRSWPTVSRSGAIVWEQSNGSSTGIINLLPPGASAPRVLVDLNPQIKGWELGSQETVRWKNSRGEEIEGILIKPFGYQKGIKYPLIVDGYPMQTNSFKGAAMWGNQAWASRGYAVFYPNARTPHLWWNLFKTEAYDRAGMGPKGWNVTVDDVMSGVDELIRRGLVDPNRMGLYGFSNGGGVADYLVTRTDRFKCAVSIAAVWPDWAAPVFLEGGPAIPLFAGGITPWDDPAAYIELSAVYHLNKVSTPMLLADGDNDGDFLLGMIEMYNGLRYLGKDVTFLRYPDQGHGFAGPAMKDFWERENAFFDKYLKPEQPPK